LNPFTQSGLIMPIDRRPAKDPRTVARDIPGIFDTMFPQLTPSLVAHFNSKIISFSDCKSVPDDLVQASGLNRAMLFEVAFARGEQIIAGIEKADWNACLNTALKRQRKYFDAKLPETLLEADKKVAECVARNLAIMLKYIQERANINPLVRSPKIPGYQWITSGYGDFSLGTKIIEVKCTNKKFSASDYRQIVMYWLLSYASSIERETPEWTDGILINPRLNYIFEFSFDDMLAVIGAGRSKLELLELFSSIVSEHSLRMLASLNQQ